jgi:hypothetical protein
MSTSSRVAATIVRCHRTFRSSGLSLLALAGALACGEEPAPTGPDFAKMAVPLTATPASLDFASPAATPQTLTATVQYTGVITATGAGCATVSPVSVPATKPPGSSVYLARFTVTPAAVGVCTLTLTDKKGVRVSVPVNVGAAGAMFFVAHEDDDLLFLNPDIDAAFAAGKYVTTVYLTAGSCTGDVGEGAYYRTREAGVLAAYARLAGVADEWTLTSQPIRELTLTAQPRISLVFFRLPASKSEAGNVCDLAATNLRGLWNDGVASPTLAMTSLDSLNSYTRSQLIAALTGLIRRWHPARIETLDASGLFGQGADPSGRQIVYPALGGRCYYYDHSDHYYSAKFTRVASDAYSDLHTLARHRGYNQANEAANVTGTDLTAKENVFQAYAEHDAFIPGPPYAGLYQPWLERQYDADGSPAPVQTLCGLLGFAQAASSSATSGQPLIQQPIVQLQDADGANVAVSGVQVTVGAISPANDFTTLSTVATDANGRATFTGLTITGGAGQYFLDFTAPGYTENAVPVDVAAGP